MERAVPITVTMEDLASFSIDGFVPQTIRERQLMEIIKTFAENKAIETEARIAMMKDHRQAQTDQAIEYEKQLDELRTHIVHLLSQVRSYKHLVDTFVGKQGADTLPTPVLSTKPLPSGDTTEESYYY